LLAALIKNPVQIVHLNTSLEPKSYWRDSIYLIVARLMHRKVVYQVHGGALPQDFFPAKSVRAKLLRWLLQTSDAVVLLARVEEEAYRAFAPTVPLRVIPNAIDARSLAAFDIAAKPASFLHLVYVGRLAEDKGIFEALRAVDILVRRGRAVKFTVAGSGPDAKRFQSRVIESALEDYVHCVGPIFGQAKDELWNAGHIFVFPTWHREGLPYALLEAMAAGAVPVTSRVGAIPDVIQDGIHGLFVRPDQPEQLATVIARLDDDRTLLARMAEAGRKRISEEYQVEQLARRFAHLYDSLVRKN
jgi:glycosyltransferase involved in cell wall biosynthesis